MKERVLYCAYGSNINMSQMNQRCPEASVVGVGYADGYELEFNKVANIVKKKNSKVPVVLWSCTKKDMASLDTYEGYPHKYIKQGVEVSVGKGEKYNAVAYVRRGTPAIEPPAQDYYQRIETGYTEFGLNLQYLEEAYDNAVEQYREPFDYYSLLGDDNHLGYSKPSDTDLLKAFVAGQTFEKLGFEQTSLEERAMIAKLIIKEYNGNVMGFENYCTKFFESFIDNPQDDIKYKKYVAYGSNMNIADMQYRCPKSKIADVGRLEGYELKFNGCLTIKPNPKEYTPVVVWDIHPDDWQRLDTYEGYPSYYRKETVPVNIKGEKSEAVVYIMNVSDNIYSPPSPTYYKTVKKGYMDNGISLTKLNNALEKAKTEFEGYKNTRQNNNIYKTTRKR